MISTQHVRQLALALLLSAGCGDDGGDDDDGPSGDGGQTEAGSPEGGAPDGGPSIDGGGGDPDASDAKVLLDANLADGSSPTDASAEELQAALVRDGIRYDMRRADLTIQAFCNNGVRCNFNGNPNLTEQICLDILFGVWLESVRAGDSPACLDALLDYNSCGAQLACNTEGCGAEQGVVESVCTSDAGT